MTPEKKGMIEKKPSSKMKWRGKTNPIYTNKGQTCFLKSWLSSCCPGNDWKHQTATHFIQMTGNNI